MSPKLASLTIENFRSILGRIVVPLDAQVVLIHGSNGMGKTSILSALELALTGKIAHLEGKSTYKDFLTNFEAQSGSVDLVVQNLSSNSGASTGRLTFTPTAFEATPTLPALDAAFFSERCYLPQAVLSRLLEIYDEQNRDANSRLTQFVKQLLRLDPLDALADGLSHAFHVTRVRKIAPAYKQLEALLDNYDTQVKRLEDNVASARAAISARLTTLNDILPRLSVSGPKLEMGFEIKSLREKLADRQDDEQKLSEAVQEKTIITSLISRLTSLDSGSPDVNTAQKERAEALASAEFEKWLNGPGAQIAQIMNELRQYNSELPTSDSDVATVVDEALLWCASEVSRCSRVLEQHDAANSKLSSARGIVQRATTRIGEINEVLSAGAKNARTLANALAGIAPHVEDDVCPVCGRDYNEMEVGPLTAHIAATIASLTTEAGRLQALAAERATENERLTVAQRDLVTAERGILSSDAVLIWRQRLSAITSLNGRLAEVQTEAINGKRIREALTVARQDVRNIHTTSQSTATLLPEIRAVVEKTTGRPPTEFSTLQEGLHQAQLTVLDSIVAIERGLNLRISLASELDQYQRESELLSDRVQELGRIKERSNALKETIDDIGNIRDTAKLVATAASSVRSAIVRDVFSGSLNTVWRDLFVRLAPGEKFVPQFQLPFGDDGKVEAVLETLHKSGQAGGPPGAMLSQGNLNTAALTLFLALHLSVPSQFPWLVLDDPVQSMDDVHVAQFAALLRTLSKGLGRQLIVAVHERALFDYLTLELSPSFPGDSLLAVEVSKNYEGTTIADPRYYEFEVDKAVAA